MIARSSMQRSAAAPRPSTLVMRAASYSSKRRKKKPSTTPQASPSASASKAPAKLSAAEAAAEAARKHAYERANPAAAALGAIAEAEASLSTRDHLIRLGLWALISLNVGAYFSQGDEGAQLLENADEFSQAVLQPNTAREALETALERMARGLALNDSLKLRLLGTPGLVERLIELVGSQSVTLAARNHAVKVLEAMSGSAEAQREMVRRGDHERLIDLMSREGTSLFARKALAHAITNLAQLPELAGPLARAGAVGALVAEQQHDPRLVRQRVALGAARLAHAARALGPDVMHSVSAEERETIIRLAEEEDAAAAADGAMHGIKATLIESGVLLYLHTAGGGAAWGLFESIRNQQPRAQLVQNVVRTGVVTCFVPILLVGGVVTGYMKLNRATDSIREKFGLYFGACLALYPASRLLTVVERFAPLWLGGHIVGFSSFFVWTLYTESDLLKSDALLDGPAPTRKRTVVVWEANDRTVPPPKPAEEGGAAVDIGPHPQPRGRPGAASTP